MVEFITNIRRQSTNQLASVQVLLLETTYHKLLNILMNATVTNVSAKETLTFLILYYSLHAREPNEFIWTSEKHPPK